MNAYSALVKACWFACVTASLGETATAAELSLREAVMLVFENNPQFQIYELRQQALEGAAQTADLKPPVEVSAEVENIAGTGDLRWFKATEWTLSLSQVIERGDKRQRRNDVVRQRQAVLEAEQQIMELDLLSAVAATYTELTAAAARLDVLGRSAMLAAEVLADIEERVAAGRSPAAEQARARAAVAQAELLVQSAEYTVRSAGFRLSAHWGDFSGEDITSTAQLLPVEPLTSIDELLAALAQSPAIRVFTSQTRLREAELSLAQAQQQADIALGGGVRRITALDDTAFVLQFSMPLKARERARGAMTTAQANLLRVDAEREAALWAMQGQLLALDQQRRAAIASLQSLSDSIIPQLESAFEATRLAYDSGLYSFVELSSARQALLEAELTRIEAAAQAHRLRIEIERLSGQTFNVAATGNGGNL